MKYIQRVTVPKPGKDVAGRFPFSIPIFIDGFDFEFKKPVTIFAGENASGKSTFLESLAAVSGYPRQGGFHGQNMLRKSWGMNSFGEMLEVDFDNLVLGDHMRIEWNGRPRKGYFFRSEFMSETMQSHWNARDLMTMSHGEGILELVRTRFKDGLFILDEPESALSPTSLLALATLIHDNARMFQAQYIMVTHSPILMSIMDADFYWIGEGSVQSMNYKDSPHFTISKMFFDNPDRMIGLVKSS
ncbi:MAG: AAA family ATPase [Firmicutes bacterium]|nr:AAA family ATPase [Bacillota bacterium]